ncbi:MAG: hypothetical protein MPN21_16645, partial [Thermoanaerobaculia bacterium]|nr:hypothetical protein [Thermoanaerobaculia bacterium]
LLALPPIGSGPGHAIDQGNELLRLEPACRVEIDGSVTLTPTLVNESPSHKAVLMGIRLGNGISYHPSLTVEMVSNDPSGAGVGAVDFDYFGPMVSGRVDPWIQPLPAGSRFRWSIELQKFYSYELEARLSDSEFPIKISLRLEASEIEDIAYRRDAFKGTLRSATITVPRDCKGSIGES